MKNPPKVSLEELKVESFVTELKNEEDYKGGFTSIPCILGIVALEVLTSPGYQNPEFARQTTVMDYRATPASETDFQTDCLGAGIEVICTS